MASFVLHSGEQTAYCSKGGLKTTALNQAGSCLGGCPWGGSEPGEETRLLPTEPVGLGDLWVTGKRIGVEGREVARPRLCGAGHSVGHCPESGVREGGENEGGSPPGGKAAGTQRDSQKARVVL